MSSSPPLDLGFLDSGPSWRLCSRFFPSKVGSRPAWLHLRPLPEPASMQCPNCQEPLIFLCQVYAPLDALARAFHRTVYVFLCRHAACHAANQDAPFMVWRSQLARDNPFYPSEPPVERPDWRPELQADSHGQSLCRVCGGAGPKKCTGCQQAHYCSREHQVWDWKTGGHKGACQSAEETSAVSAAASLLLPEFELNTEPAEDEDHDRHSDNDDDDEDVSEVELARFRELQLKKETGSLPDDDEAFKQAENGENVDMTFVKFRTVVDHTPDQVIRFQRRGRPLWISSEAQLNDDDVPPCQRCGGPRVFEFQIMPQMLASLQLDSRPDEASIDWGVLAVYTCQDSCQNNEKEPYVKEFIYRQNPPSGQSP